MTFQTANGLYKIISSCGTKVDSLAVSVNECWHVMSFVDVSLIAYDLLTLFGGKDLCVFVSKPLTSKCNKSKREGLSLPFNLFPEARHKS